MKFMESKDLWCSGDKLVVPKDLWWGGWSIGCTKGSLVEWVINWWYERIFGGMDSKLVVSEDLWWSEWNFVV